METLNEPITKLTNKDHYANYVEDLYKYSNCMQPVIKAHTARYLHQTPIPALNVDLDTFCVFERKELEISRATLKKAKSQTDQ